MTLDIANYNVTGGNLPLNHARILWDPVLGSSSGNGTTPGAATNDYSFQRWTATTFPAEWILTLTGPEDVDTVVVAAHNLSSVGATIEIATSPDAAGAVWTVHATLEPNNNNTIASLFNQGSGAPYSVQRVRITLTGGAGTATIGIIRAGVSLQMQRPVFGGHNPILLNEEIDTTSNESELGAWLGRTTQRRAYVTDFDWDNLDDYWVRSEFEPFRKVAVDRPFAIIENASRMPEGVAWCWTDQSPRPTNSGVRNLMSINMPVRGVM